MMNKITKKFISVLAALAMLAVMSAAAFAVTASEAEAPQYTIDTPYEYPLTPEDTEAWRALPQTLDAKIEACQVPAEILNAMTTPALVETVLDYPLLLNMLVFNTTEDGFYSVLSYCHALRTLAERPDAPEILYGIIIEIEASGLLGQETFSQEECDLLVRYGEAAIIKTMVQKLHTPKIVPLTGFAPDKIEARKLYSLSTVSTPGGASVQVILGLTWQDQANDYNAENPGANYTATSYETFRKAIHNNIQSLYPGVVAQAGISPVYNCHNYAWRTSGQTTAWMNNPAPYWGANGGYTSGSAQVGGRVYYNGAGTLNGPHSGIVTALPVTGSPNVYVRSKWDDTGVYLHAALNCPFGGTLTFYN
jgi:hypothetical protein